jgi:hypothetical protein
MNEGIPGVVIDGAISRTPTERIHTLLDYADFLIESDDRSENADKLAELKNEFRSDDFSLEFWTEFEDDVISLINDMLPDDYICTVGEFDPGTVIVRKGGTDNV